MVSTERSAPSGYEKQAKQFANFQTRLTDVVGAGPGTYHGNFWFTLPGGIIVRASKGSSQVHFAGGAHSDKDVYEWVREVVVDVLRNTDWTWHAKGTPGPRPTITWHL